MELYRAYFRMIRHHIRGVLIYVLIVIGIVITLTIQVPNIQNSYTNRVLDQYSDMWTAYFGQAESMTEFHLYQRFEGESNNAVLLYTFLNYAAFSIFSLTATGVCLMLLQFQSKDINHRIRSAPITNGKLMRTLMLGSIIFAFVIWFIHMIAGLYLIGVDFLCFRGLMIAVNILSLALAAIGFASLVARFPGRRGKNGITASILSIIICFVSGVFTPQFILSNAAKTIAVFTPTYWYARANSLIGEYQFAEYADYAEVLRCIGIQLLFAAGLFLVALAIDKHREKEETVNP